MKILVSSVFSLCVVFATSLAFGQAIQIPVQGFVTDVEGAVLDGATTMTFSLKRAPDMASVWTVERQVDVQDGHFALYLGADKELPATIFDAEASFFLGITVGDGDELPLIDVGYSPLAAVALSAVDAETLQGKSAEDLDSLAKITCVAGQVLSYDGSAWTCGDVSDTLAELSCTTGQVALYDGSGWACENASDADTLAALNCTQLQIARWDGFKWVCSVDNRRNEVEVDAFVSNNGYAQADELNDGSGLTTPVGWMDLVNIPSDIVNGDDDTTLSEADVDAFVANNGFADASELNDGSTSTTPVGWGDITGIPAGLADGDDDTTLSEADVDAYVANNGYLTSVNWMDLVGIPLDIADGDDVLTEAQVDAYVANNGFVSAAELVDGDLATAPVDWGDITNKPVTGDLTGSGTLGYLASFTGAKTLGNSVIFQNTLGNVGFGTTSISSRVEVAGDVEADGFAFRSPRTRWSWITPRGLDWNGAGSLGSDPAAISIGFEYAFTPLPAPVWIIDPDSTHSYGKLGLPHQAQVQEFSCSVEDLGTLGGADMTVTVTRADMNGADTTVGVGSVSTTDAQTGLVTFSVTGFTDTIDNENYQYSMFLSLDATTSTIWTGGSMSPPTALGRMYFHGCRIAYTSTGL